MCVGLFQALQMQSEDHSRSALFGNIGLFSVCSKICSRADTEMSAQMREILETAIEGEDDYRLNDNDTKTLSLR